MEALRRMAQPRPLDAAHGDAQKGQDEGQPGRVPAGSRAGHSAAAPSGAVRRAVRQPGDACRVRARRPGHAHRRGREHQQLDEREGGLRLHRGRQGVGRCGCGDRCCVQEARGRGAPGGV